MADADMTRRRVEAENPTADTENRQAATGPSAGVTRRQLLVAATAGGAALAATALGGAAVGSLTTKADYEVRLAGDQVELTKLRVLVGLYENLEKVGIDTVIVTGMNVISGSLDAVKASVQLVRNGITATENALQAFQGMLESLHSQVDRARQGLNDLMSKFQAAQGLVTGALGQALPLAESIQSFFSAILDKVPFGVGDNIRKGVEALVSLIQAIPTAVDTVTGQLLKPLTDTFFPPSGPAPVKGTLFDPITQHLLQPLDKFLGDVEDLMTKWQTDFTAPVKAALQEREQIRQQIADYRKKNGI